ncbi:MAG: HNH endonuclease [Acidobacteriales bacterium]|nr:HNH endonuclease [Terriglobales bacterium]
MRKITAEYYEAFHAKVERESACWIWQGALGGNGYGYFRRELAHRISYEMYKGKIPRKKQIDHVCKRSACVNPEHLEIVTSTINTRRGGVAKLTPQQVHEIRTRFVPGIVTQTSLAKEYGVHSSQVSRIVNEKAWRDKL